MRSTSQSTTDIANRAISLYDYLESSMRAGARRRNVLAGEGDKVAAVADAHRAVSQDLERLAARSGLGT